MWSKSQPGPFDRYTTAEADEPLFVLRGTDPVSCLLVSLWIGVHDLMGGNPPEAVLDAMQCSLALEHWARTHGSNVDLAVQACLKVLRNTSFSEFASQGMPCIKCDSVMAVADRATLN